MVTQILTEKTSPRDLRAALGDRFGQILAAEGHLLLQLAEPDEVYASWKSWACMLPKPDRLYPTRPASKGNKPVKQQAGQTQGDRGSAESVSAPRVKMTHAALISNPMISI